MTATPWQVNDEREPLRGAVIRALLEQRDRLMTIDPWLAFPQAACSFSFGPDGRPLPIGALFTFWDSCSEMVGACAHCGDDGYGYAFGGGLVVGWRYRGVQRMPPATLEALGRARHREPSPEFPPSGHAVLPQDGLARRHLRVRWP